MTLKLGAMATSFEPSEKGIKSAIYDQIPTIWWKFGENWSSTSWDHFAEVYLIKNEKEINARKHTDRGAGMPRGLNDDVVRCPMLHLVQRRQVRTVGYPGLSPALRDEYLTARHPSKAGVQYSLMFSVMLQNTLDNCGVLRDKVLLGKIPTKCCCCSVKGCLWKC